MSGLAAPSDSPQIIKAGKDDLISTIEKSLLQTTLTSHVNAYLIEGKKGNLLIDTGWYSPASYSLLTGELKNYGFEIRDVTQIICTHLHPDHCGAAGRIKEVSGASIAMGEGDASLFSRRYIDVDKLLEQMKGFLSACGVPEEELSALTMSSMPARELVVKTPPDKKLKAGNKFSIEPFEFRVIATPGHSHGHICLYEPHRKLLFAGDHVLPEIFPFIGLHPQSGENPLGDYINSLKEMLKLKVTLTFPGHGPAFSGLEGRINEIMEYHERKNKTIGKALANGPLTAYQVAKKSDDGDDGFHSLNSLNRRLSILDTLAHLRLMRNRGDVNEYIKDGVYYYGV
jgi:glyoxylase-like metal-dependent hydrolase (beta-lactamase superfamily II)